MQRVLEKMAKQLNDYDEASLMHLWQRYAARVHDFEPTRRWEEAAIALCLIQAVHWKNQLFNYRLAASATPVDKSSLPPLPEAFTAQRTRGGVPRSEESAAKTRATVLRFPEKGEGGAERAASENAMKIHTGQEQDASPASSPETTPESDG